MSFALVARISVEVNALSMPFSFLSLLLNWIVEYTTRLEKLMVSNSAEKLRGICKIDMRFRLYVFGAPGGI